MWGLRVVGLLLFFLGPESKCPVNLGWGSCTAFNAGASESHGVTFTVPTGHHGPKSTQIPGEGTLSLKGGASKTQYPGSLNHHGQTVILLSE